MTESCLHLMLNHKNFKFPNISGLLTSPEPNKKKIHFQPLRKSDFMISYEIIQFSTNKFQCWHFWILFRMNIKWCERIFILSLHIIHFEFLFYSNGKLILGIYFSCNICRWCDKEKTFKSFIVFFFRFYLNSSPHSHSKLSCVFNISHSHHLNIKKWN